MSFDIASSLLAWYEQNARELPWRVPPDNGQPYNGLAKPKIDAYAVWVSEIMLQQTRVETVIPYFKRWMERFPEVAVLAAVSQQEALAAWEGLGYYGRARNLHKAAQLVMQSYGGEIPRDPQVLQKLPGIGRYTAGAIASIAYGLDVPVLDGNIRRILARFFNIMEPANRPPGEQRLWELAGENLPPGRAGDYNQALMDLGASICTPRSPACERCPLTLGCKAFAIQIQEERPVLQSKPAVPHYVVTAAVITQDGRFLIAQRPPDGLLGGMWEFPGGKLQDGEDLGQCLKREILEELGAQIDIRAPFGIYRHAYTHFRVTLHAFCCTLYAGSRPSPIQAQNLRWITPGELPAFPMGKIDRMIAQRLLSENTLC